MWFLGPRFVGGRDTPDFGHASSNYIYFRPCGWIWFSSVQRARRLEGEKKKKEERRKKEESLVKYKSADNFVGRPKYNFVTFQAASEDKFLVSCIGSISGFACSQKATDNSRSGTKRTV